jgi:hypothetical protein
MYLKRRAMLATLARLPVSLRAALALAALVLVANAPLLSGAYNCDPSLFLSGLAPVVPLSGNVCYLDPSVGLITQPLGALAAQDWLHATPPWWNPYGGVGLPLAAEGQDESLFLPFVLLLKFHNGWLYQRLAFQFLSGVFTWALLRRLGLRDLPALTGAGLFALNGSFYIFAGVSGPVFFLPLLLLGLERARDAAINHRKRGWGVLPLAVAGSVYAGFPELAYFNGMLGFVWALGLLALSPGARLRLFGKFAWGALLGGALTLPQVVPFLGYLQVGDTGLHTGMLSWLYYPPVIAILQMFPLTYGALSEFARAGLYKMFAVMWQVVGGWLGCTPVLLAWAALRGGMPSPGRRWLLAGWALVWEARFLGNDPVQTLVNLIPGVAISEAVRYANVSVEFAVFVLAAFALDDILRGGANWRALRGPLLGFSACLAISVVPGFRRLPEWFHANPTLLGMALLSTAGALAASALALRALRTGRGLGLAAAALLAGTAATFALPQLGGLHGVALDESGPAYLQAHIRLSRYATFTGLSAQDGPYASNFPDADGVATLKWHQIPSPHNWDDFYMHQLIGLPQSFPYGEDTGPAEPAALYRNLPGLESLGVKYIGMWPFDDLLIGNLAPPPPSASTPGPASGAPLVLTAGQSLSGQMPAPLPRLGAISVTLGTFKGRSNGPLTVTLCQGATCVTAQADLTLADDGAPFLIPLPAPLVLTGSAPLRYTLGHPAGEPVALWLNAQHAPLLGLWTAPPPNVPAPVFHGPLMTLYQLPYPAPYAEAGNAACNLVIYSRQHLRSACPAPATLLRRELFYPGWHATVNGQEVPVTQTNGLFQQIPLPAGGADIRFTYTPPHMRAAVAAALLALLLWAGAYLRRGQSRAA